MDSTVNPVLKTKFLITPPMDGAKKICPTPEEMMRTASRENPLNWIPGGGKNMAL